MGMRTSVATALAAMAAVASVAILVGVLGAFPIPVWGNPSGKIASNAPGGVSSKALNELPLSPPLEPDFSTAHVQLWPGSGFEQRYVQRLQTFDSLLLLLQAANQLPNFEISLAAYDCDDRSIRYSPLGRELSFCYRLLSDLEDGFDDLSASPRERELAVLDAVYFLVVRQMAQILLADAGLPSTGRSLDELTAVLPALLKQRSLDMILSGTQWIFNQGNPLGLPQDLAQIQGEALTLDHYERLICTSYGLDPALYPYLVVEVPWPERLADCRDSGEAIARWTRLLKV